MSIQVGIVGNPTSGYKYIGPFDDQAEAFEIMDREYPYEMVFVATMDPIDSEDWQNPLMQLARFIDSYFNKNETIDPHDMIRILTRARDILKEKA